MHALAKYLKSCDGFDQLMQGFKAKYESYGRFSGSVKITIHNDHDLFMLEGLMHRSYHGYRQITISSNAFLKALAKGRYGQVDGKALLEAYFGCAMKSQREHKQAINDQRIALLNEICEVIPELVQPYQHWIHHPVNMQRVDQWFNQCIQWLNQDDSTVSECPAMLSLLLRLDKDGVYPLNESLKVIGMLLALLPFDGVYLSVAASWLCHDPHGFDHGTPLENLLLSCIRYCASNRKTTDPLIEIFPVYQKEALLLDGGILINDLSNTVTIAGLLANDSNGINHTGLNGFYDRHQSIQLSLSLLRQLKDCHCPNNRLIIVENPSIYSMLLQQWDGSYGLMCSNGQPRLSTLTMLAKLKETNTFVSYSGDFDPEGLLIAQKLCAFYGCGFNYWRMGVDDYLATNPGKSLIERRIKMLDKITDAKLRATSAKVRELKMAGYQEAIWERYIADISEWSKNL